MESVNFNTKLLSLKDFMDMGYLQEVNRRFFYPLGLALFVTKNNNTGEVLLGGVFDNRDLPNKDVGVIDDAEEISKGKFIDSEFSSRTKPKLSVNVSSQMREDTFICGSCHKELDYGWQSANTTSEYGLICLECESRNIEDGLEEELIDGSQLFQRWYFSLKNSDEGVTKFTIHDRANDKSYSAGTNVEKVIDLVFRLNANSKANIIQVSEDHISVCWGDHHRSSGCNYEEEI